MLPCGPCRAIRQPVHQRCPTVLGLCRRRSESSDRSSRFGIDQCLARRPEVVAARQDAHRPSLPDQRCLRKCMESSPAATESRPVQGTPRGPSVHRESRFDSTAAACGLRPVRVRPVDSGHYQGYSWSVFESGWGGCPCAALRLVDDWNGAEDPQPLPQISGLLACGWPVGSSDGPICKSPCVGKGSTVPLCPSQPN